MNLKPDVTIAETDAGAVLLDEQSGRYWQLNPTGSTVIRLLVEGASVDDAVRRLVGTDEQRDQVARDVEAFTEQLIAAGLVR